MTRWMGVGAWVIVAAVLVQAQQPQRPGGLQPPSSQQPARDTSAQKDTPPTPTGRISGRVVAADSGRPVKRARVFITSSEIHGARGLLADDTGVFDRTDLPAGRYPPT